MCFAVQAETTGTGYKKEPGISLIRFSVSQTRKWISGLYLIKLRVFIAKTT